MSFFDPAGRHEGLDDASDQAAASMANATLEGRLSLVQQMLDRAAAELSEVVSQLRDGGNP